MTRICDLKQPWTCPCLLALGRKKGHESPTDCSRSTHRSCLGFSPLTLMHWTKSSPSIISRTQAHQLLTELAPSKLKQPSAPKLSGDTGSGRVKRSLEADWFNGFKVPVSASGANGGGRITTAHISPTGPASPLVLNQDIGVTSTTIEFVDGALQSAPSCIRMTRAWSGLCAHPRTFVQFPAELLRYDTPHISVHQPKTAALLAGGVRGKFSLSWF